MKLESKKFLESANSCITDADWAMVGNRYKNVANRSYYAVFNSIRALLFEQSVFAKTHQGVHRKFHELFIKTGLFTVEYSDILALSAKWREEGDYDNEVIISKEIATTTLENAKKFFEKTEEFLKED